MTISFAVVIFRDFVWNTSWRIFEKILHSLKEYFQCQNVGCPWAGIWLWVTWKFTLYPFTLCLFRFGWMINPKKWRRVTSFRSNLTWKMGLKSYFFNIKNIVLIMARQICEELIFRNFIIIKLFIRVKYGQWKFNKVFC